VKHTYLEPTVLWRARTPDGRAAHATIVPSGFVCTVVWFVNGEPMGGQEFPEWEDALAFAERLRGEFSSDSDA
jgi:hypothetical protein